MKKDIITKLEALSVTIPLDTPIWASGLKIEQRDFFLIRLTTESGRQGYGFHKSRGLHLDRIALENLAPHVIGSDPWMVKKTWDNMYQGSLMYGRTGAVMRAIGTIDIALWDLRAKIAEVPLYKMLGGYRDECRAIVVTGYYEVDHHETGPMMEDIQYHVKNGVNFFKIAAGMLDAESDRKRIAAAREAAGPEAELVVDVNWVWTDIKEALRTARLWEPYRLSWIEEPFPPGSTFERQQFAEQSPVAVGIGDEQSGIPFFRDLMASHSTHMLRIDTPVIGGITPAITLASMAEAWGLSISTHIYPEINVHIVAAYKNAVGLELFSDRSELYKIDAFITPNLQIVDGKVKVPEIPGLGFELNWDELTKFSI
jgi:L-alanine-DL-glutamate epimerase-like enolase superfamily enzyme